MSVNDKRIEAPKDSSRTLIIAVAIGAAIVIAGFFYLLLRAAGTKGSSEPTLQGAIRQGSTDFDQYKARIMLDEPEADEAKRALGDTVMSLHTTVRNFTGRTIDGLEIRGVVVDHQGKAVKERTVVVVPTKLAELAPNKTLPVSIMLEGMSDTDDRADVKMEVTGFKFKQ
jgi:hypothetical protein